MRRMRGVAFVETAIWIAVVLPVGLVGAGLVGLIHDQNVLMGIPSSVMREGDIPGGAWSLRGDGVSEVTFDTTALARTLHDMAMRARAEATHGVLRTEKVSSKACYWIFSVNTRTGSLENPISSECRSQGPEGGGLSFEDLLRRERGDGRGILLGSKGGDGAYADRVALVGVGIRGDFPGVLSSAPLARIEWGEVSYPRQEVGL